MGGKTDLPGEGKGGQLKHAESAPIIEIMENIQIPPLQILYHFLSGSPKLSVRGNAFRAARGIEHLDFHGHCTGVATVARSSAAIMVHSFTGWVSLAQSAIS